MVIFLVILSNLITIKRVLFVRTLRNYKFNGFKTPKFFILSKHYETTEVDRRNRLVYFLGPIEKAYNLCIYSFGTQQTPEKLTLL